MNLSFLQYLGICILDLIGFYIVIRLLSKAAFKSYFEEYFEAKQKLDVPKPKERKENEKCNMIERR